MNILAIDPSLNSLGFAFFDGPKLVASGTLTATKLQKAENLVQRIKFILSKLDNMDDGQDALVIEQPQSWGAYKSIASAHSGGLLSLHILVGALVGWGLKSLGVMNVHLIPVSKWKGQLPKRVTRHRMEEKYHTRFDTDDESDAVGLGDWFIGKAVKSDA